MKLLILGGTGEATRLAELLAGRPDIEATISLAGRTSRPAALPLPTRIGGFGGADGLAAHLTAEGIDLLIDATHPFAERISANARAASRATGVPLLVLTRAPWTARPGDRWTEVASLDEAAAVLGPAPRRVLLTVGRLGLAAFEAAPQHDYLIRSIDPPDGLDLPLARVILDRPPFDAEAEEKLMREEAVEVLVTKNSGGPATYGKIEAARRLALPVILVAPPRRADAPTLHRPEDVLDHIDHARLPAERGVSSQGSPPGRGTKRLSEEPTITQVAMSTRPGSQVPSVARRIVSSGRPTARAKATGVSAAFSRQSRAIASKICRGRALEAGL